MVKRAQIERPPDTARVYAATTSGLLKPTKGQEWRKDLLVSGLFQTCIRLQTSLDRRFLRFGMTVQEARVLVRCVAARKTTPGQLALNLARDKGKMSRFIHRLEVSHLVVREADRRDRRFCVVTPTAKGKRLARRLALVFDSIRKQLFAGILETDIRQLTQVILQLHKNAACLALPRKREGAQRRGCAGNRGPKSATAMQTVQLQPSSSVPEPMQSVLSDQEPASGHSETRGALTVDGEGQAGTSQSG